MSSREILIISFWPSKLRNFMNRQFHFTESSRTKYFDKFIVWVDGYCLYWFTLSSSWWLASISTFWPTRHVLSLVPVFLLCKQSNLFDLLYEVSWSLIRLSWGYPLITDFSQLFLWSKKKTNPVILVVLPLSFRKTKIWINSLKRKQVAM